MEREQTSREIAHYYFFYSNIFYANICIFEPNRAEFRAVTPREKKKCKEQDSETGTCHERMGIYIFYRICIATI